MNEQGRRGEFITRWDRLAKLSTHCLCDVEVDEIKVNLRNYDLRECELMLQVFEPKEVCVCGDMHISNIFLPIV